MEPLYIVWRDEYDTGIPVLDEQMRGLVSLINSFYFHRADASREIERVLVPTAEMFKSYVQINFFTLEQLMDQAGYPELEKYRELHRVILRSIAKKDAIYRAQRDVDGLLIFLKKYWLATVRANTAHYLDYLREYFRIDKPE